MIFKFCVVFPQIEVNSSTLLSPDAWHVDLVFVNWESSGGGRLGSCGSPGSWSRALTWSSRFRNTTHFLKHPNIVRASTPTEDDLRYPTPDLNFASSLAFSRVERWVPRVAVTAASSLSPCPCLYSMSYCARTSTIRKYPHITQWLFILSLSSLLLHNLWLLHSVVLCVVQFPLHVLMLHSHSLFGHSIHQDC